MNLYKFLLIGALFSPLMGIAQGSQMLLINDSRGGVVYTTPDGMPPTPPGMKPVVPASVKGSVMGTVSVGFFNSYRNEYTVPEGFDKGNMTGFAPIYARAEYGISHKVTLGLATSWSTIYFNSYKTDVGYSGPIKRYYPNTWRLFSGGLIAYYHFNHLIQVEGLDVFAGAGLNLNNISETARPQGDSIIVKRSHTATPTIKVGARYYITPAFSVFADAGYDRLSIFSVGMSVRFLRGMRVNEISRK